MSVLTNKEVAIESPTEILHLPFALPIIQGKKTKKKCCKKYLKKGKRCKSCPGR